MFTRRKQNEAVPEVGAEAPEFNLPSAQGGQLRLSMRTVRGPVVVAFYRPGNEEDVEYFKTLAEKEQEINMASASVVGIGVAEPDAAREFARASGLESYLLYDYARVTSAQWGVLEGDRRHGYSSRPAVFVVGPDGNVAHAWSAGRPAPDEPWSSSRSSSRATAIGSTNGSPPRTVLTVATSASSSRAYRSARSVRCRSARRPMRVRDVTSRCSMRSTLRSGTACRTGH